MPVPVVVDGDLQTIDWTNPDGINIVWPTPRDMKYDMILFLRDMFRQWGGSFAKISVVPEGAFKSSMLIDEKTKEQRPVICMVRTGDPSSHEGVGEILYYNIFDSASGDWVDVTNTLIKAIPEGAPIQANGQMSSETIDVEIYDLNQQRANQMYQLIKILFVAATKGFMNIGYLDFIRTNGQDESPIQLTQDGGEKMIFQRTLTYSGKHFDFIEGIQGLKQLIETTFTGAELDPTGMSAETVELNVET